MSEIYYQYNPWWENDSPGEDIIDRPDMVKYISSYITGRQIIILTGLRRVGKTSLMKLVIKKLISQGIDSRDLFYVSLDDYSLLSKSIPDIVDDYRSIHKIPADRSVFLFLDEITFK